MHSLTLKINFPLHTFKCWTRTRDQMRWSQCECVDGLISLITWPHIDLITNISHQNLYGQQSHETEAVMSMSVMCYRWWWTRLSASLSCRRFPLLRPSVWWCHRWIFMRSEPLICLCGGTVCGRNQRFVRHSWDSCSYDASQGFFHVKMIEMCHMTS